MRIWLQAASSSSATRVARPVCDPWPISRCLAITVTVLSAPMWTKAFGARAVADGAADGIARERAGRQTPITRAPRLEEIAARQTVPGPAHASSFAAR